MGETERCKEPEEPKSWIALQSDRLIMIPRPYGKAASDW